jgi:transcription antitermination factor NusG
MISPHWNTRARQRALLFAFATLVILNSKSLMFASPAQAAPALTSAPAAGSRVTGRVTAIDGNVLTVKDDKGAEVKVTVGDSARLLQMPPGAKTLSSAIPIKVQDIAVGDRILAKTAPAADGNGFTASTVVAMKQADIAQKQQHDREDWQTRGISGVVKSIDPAAKTVIVSTGNGAAAKLLNVQASATTVIRRYAPDSTKFDDAKPATLDQIKPGDQLRAKGDKNPDGSQFTAEDIVAGTFRNIAGTVVSVDPATKTVVVTDLATKRPFQVAINSDSQLHKLSPEVAQGLAARLKGGGSGAGHAGASGPHSAPAASAMPNREQPSGPAAETTGRHGGGDLQQMLNGAPTLQLADLKKGDAVMVLTTEGETPGAATAITLLAGVEPLLQASTSASQSLLSASWNVGGGGAGGQDAQ